MVETGRAEVMYKLDTIQLRAP